MRPRRRRLLRPPVQPRARARPRGRRRRDLVFLQPRAARRRQERAPGTRMFPAAVMDDGRRRRRLKEGGLEPE
jgi:hypothetical protein